MSPDSVERNFGELMIIIPQHGLWEQTVACCSSLWRHHGKSVSITVVDDGSCTEDRRASRRFLPSDVHWIEQQHRGVTAAWNRGIRSCRAPYIALLNNDVVTTGPWIEDLIGQSTRERGTVVGAELRRESPLLGTQEPGLFKDQKLLAGWCLCFARETYEKVGGFDESMSLYWSDTDWQLRWKQDIENRSLPLGLLPAGCLQHVGHASTCQLKTRSSRWLQDRTTFFAKWKKKESC